MDTKTTYIDSLLITRLQNSDRDALRRYMVNIAGGCFISACVSILPERKQKTPFAETFSQCWEMRQRSESPDHLRNCLYQVSRNLLNRKGRQKARLDQYASMHEAEQEFF